MRDPVEDGVFFVGDSAGHCLPTTAEGIRTAFYFGLALRARAPRRRRRTSDARTGVARYGDFSDDQRWAYRWLLRVQRSAGRINPYPAMTTALQLMDRPRFIDWAFRHYLQIAPPGSSPQAT